MSNVMLSYITNDENVDVTFTRYLSMFAEALQRLGIDAQKNDHNDIMIGDKKVSGNAIYHLPGKNIAHGTLLYDTDMENMLQAITPSRQKLDKHGHTLCGNQEAVARDALRHGLLHDSRGCEDRGGD